MDRRTFVGGLAASWLEVSLAAQASHGERVYRLGFLSAGTAFPSEQASRVPMILRDFGYSEGGNLMVERRYAEGKPERLAGLARDLVEARVDVIVAIGPLCVRAAKEATATVPIVMVSSGDPVAAGLVSSLARPGGNVTGILITAGGTLAGKRLELLKEAAPRADRIAFLTPDDPSTSTQVHEAQKAASALGLTLIVVDVRDRDYGRAFASMVAARSQALFVAASSSFGNDRTRIIELAAKHRLPAMYEWREQVSDGGLMTYGSSLAGTYQRAAKYVDEILRGARPGDLPIEQSSKFELVINLKTANALGLTISQSLLVRADELIQ